MILLYFASMTGAALLSFILFKPSILLANATNAIDIPNSRKTHTQPTARVGGFAFFIAFLTFLPLLPINMNWKISLILGGGTIFLVGFLDDALQLTPFAKLFGQIIASCLYFFTAVPNLNIITGAILIFWLIFVTNSINLIDGLDALAGGISYSIALCLSVLATIFNNGDVVWMSMLILFIIMGFIPRNIPPARIFMGDCGALFLGFILATASSRLILESNSFICLISVTLIFRVPSSDTVQCFFRRILKGKNPFVADKGHFHHKLLHRGFTRECAALLLISISLALGFLGVVISSIIILQ